jgi:hypothetical protein
MKSTVIRSKPTGKSPGKRRIKKSDNTNALSHQPVTAIVSSSSQAIVGRWLHKHFTRKVCTQDLLSDQPIGGVNIYQVLFKPRARAYWFHLDRPGKNKLLFVFHSMVIAEKETVNLHRSVRQ